MPNARGHASLSRHGRDRRIATRGLSTTSAPIEPDVLRLSAGPGSLHVERYGHGGQPIVLLHGFPTCSFLWRVVAPALAVAGHTAIAMDLLGYGESDRPLEADLSIAAQAEYVDRVLTELGVPHAAIVGVDMGGAVALRLAITRAVRVQRLVLVNAVAFDECPSGDVRAIHRDTARFAFRVSQGVLGAAPLIRRVLEKSVARREAMSARLIARYLAPFVGSDGVVHLLTLARSMRREDVEGLHLESIQAPTLIVWGEEDHWVDSGLPERLHGAIRGSTLIKLPGVGRLVPEEAPDILAQLIIDFVAPSAAA